MTSTPRDKWTAFLLSLAVPGAGQFWIRSWWCVAWFVGAGLLVAGWQWTDQLATSVLISYGQLASLLVVGLVSAEHARRLAENRPARFPARAVFSQVTVQAPRGRAVSVRIRIDAHCSTAQLWKHVSDLAEFLTIDPFHERVVLMRPRAAQGVDVVLHHNAVGCRFMRFGRLLRWQEGSGYSLSDLSARGPQRGFPHVFHVDIQSPPQRTGRFAAPAPVGSVGWGSRLIIEIQGTWTSRWIPVRCGLWWLRLVCLDHARLLRKALPSAGQ